jgi:hypothetical protein
MSLQFQTAAQTITSKSGSAAQIDRQVSLEPSSIDKSTTPSTQVRATLPASTRAAANRIDPAKINLTTEKLIFQSSDKLSDLLEASGIKPDVDALSIVYDLNPTIDNLKSLRPGTILTLPRLEGDLYTQLAVTQGYRMALVTDTAAFAEVRLRESQLEKLSDELATIDEKRFADPDDKDAISKATTSARNSLKLITSKRFAVSSSVLKQSSAEAEILNNMLTKALNSPGTMNRQARQNIENATAALNARSNDVARGGSGLITVDVKTVKKADGSDVPRLRVFYAPELDPEDVGDYPNPSTPTSKALPMEATFNFWAAESKNGPRVSDTVTLTVHSKGDTVTLLIK